MGLALPRRSPAPSRRAPWRRWLVLLVVLGALLLLSEGPGLATARPTPPATNSPLQLTEVALGNEASSGVGFANNATVSSGGTVSANFATTLDIYVEWNCSAPTTVSQVVFRLGLLGLVLYTDTGILTSAGQAVPCPAGGTGHWTSQVSDLTSYYYVLSGSFAGSVTVYDGSGTAIQNMSFLVTLVPPYNGLTVLTVPLGLLAVYEAYAVAVDLVRARRYLKRHSPARGRP